MEQKSWAKQKSCQEKREENDKKRKRDQQRGREVHTNSLTSKANDSGLEFWRQTLHSLWAKESLIFTSTVKVMIIFVLKTQTRTPSPVRCLSLTKQTSFSGIFADDYFRVWKERSILSKYCNHLYTNIEKLEHYQFNSPRGFSYCQKLLCPSSL
jgi:hypothetical protein